MRDGALLLTDALVLEEALVVELPLLLLLLPGYVPVSAKRRLPTKRLELWKLSGIMGNCGGTMENLGEIMGNYG